MGRGTGESLEPENLPDTLWSVIVLAERMTRIRPAKVANCAGNPDSLARIRVFICRYFTGKKGVV